MVRVPTTGPRSWCPPRAAVAAISTLGLVLLLATGCGDSGGLERSRSAPRDAPRIVESTLIDENQNGVDEGDKVVIRFNREVFTNDDDVTAILPVNLQETFGEGAVLLQSLPGSDRVEIVLGSSPLLFPGPAGIQGVTRIDIAFGAGLPSSVEGKNGLLAAPRDRGSVFLTNGTASAPVLVQACYVDSDNDGAVNEGDLVLATFDKPVEVPAAAVLTANFTLPVAGDSFGAGASLRASSTLVTNRSVTIVLGAGASLTVAKRFSSANLAAGAPSGLGTLAAGANPIRDTVSTPNAIASGVTVDIIDFDGGFFGSGREADAVFGNEAFAPALSAQVVTNPSGLDSFSGLLTVGGEVFSVSLLFVADAANDRVLVFESFPSGNFAAASFVLGQPDFQSRTDSDPTDTGPVTASARTMSRPGGVAFDPATNRLFVADTGNNRVLGWRGVFFVNGSGKLAIRNGRAADLVLGQEDFRSRRANRGNAAPSAASLSSPGGLSIGGGQLAVADTGNNRVLLFGSVPDSGGVAPGTVLGQPDFVSGAANAGGAVGASTLRAPSAVFVSDSVSVNGSAGVVLIADTGNNRVLVHQTATPSTGAAANVVLGQSSMLASASGSSATRLSSPTGVTAVADAIAVGDTSNHRIMVYNITGALGNGASGAVIGQNPPPASSPNRGGAPAANTLRSPSRLTAVDLGASFTLVVSDSRNNRVLGYQGLMLPITNPSATVVLGQSTFTGSTPGGQDLNQPSDAIVVRGRLIISDTANNRVLLFDEIPTAANQTPDVVLGQPDLFSTEPNQGGAASASTLKLPTGLASDGTRLVVADTGNHRLLIWTTLPTVDGEPADIVLGQAGFAGRMPNAGSSVGANTLHSPEGIFVDDDDRLAVADRDNNRVLIFGGFSTLASFDPANVVLGQPGFLKNEPNAGEGVGREVLNGPRDVLIGGRGGTRLYVADTGNHRVLVWKGVPRRNGRRAEDVIGQVDFTTAVVAGPRIDTLLEPAALAFDARASFLVVADSGHNRILLFRDVRPDPSRRSEARFVLGQRSFMASASNRGGATPTLATVSDPRGVFFNGFELFVADRGNARVVAWR